MLSVKVYNTHQQFAINIFNSNLEVSGKSKSDCEMRSNQSFTDEETIKINITKNNCNGSPNNQAILNSPTQCRSPNIDGELVITTNQPFNRTSSEYMTGCGKHHTYCLVPKSNNLVAMEDDCNFNINCVAVQETEV